MQINHAFDMSPDLGADIAVLSSANYFLVKEPIDSNFDCMGTLGSAGSFGGTLGTVGCFGCCC